MSNNFAFYVGKILVVKVSNSFLVGFRHIDWSTKVKDLDILGHVSSVCNGASEFTVGNVGKDRESEFVLATLNVYPAP